MYSRVLVPKYYSVYILDTCTLTQVYLRLHVLLRCSLEYLVQYILAWAHILVGSTQE